MFCLTIPSFVLDIEHCGGKCRRAGALWYGGVVEVTQLGVALPLWVPHILAEHHIWHSNRSYTLQHLHLQHINNYRTTGLQWHGRAGILDRKICTNATVSNHPIIGVTFSSLTSSGLVEAGFSMATKQSIWRRWFCMTSLHPETRDGIRACRDSRVTIMLSSAFSLSSRCAASHRMIPKSSKYPPRPWVPKGSLKVRTTHATLFLFHMGPKMRFPNLEVRE